jgi:L-ascorbate metabolism protein UlaG (beta-lactamase superfamily)
MTQPSIELTWWGSSGVSIRTPEHDLIIDPMLTDDHPHEYDYVFVSREDHDHMHSESLRRLTASPKLEQLFAPECCTVATSFDVPNHPPTEHLQFVPEGKLALVEPHYPRKGGAPSGGARTTLEFSDFRVEVTESSEREWTSGSTMRAFIKQHLPNDGTIWPAGYGDFAKGHWPTVGYFVEVEGLGIWHPGAMQMNYDLLADLKGRVDVMFVPLVSLLGAELPVFNTVRPRTIIPIQYWPAEGLLPKPDTTGITTVDVALGYPLDGADPDVFRSEVRSLIEAGWHRTLPDPARRIAQLRDMVAPLGIDVVELTPGTPMTIGTAN